MLNERLRYRAEIGYTHVRRTFRCANDASGVNGMKISEYWVSLSRTLSNDFACAHCVSLWITLILGSLKTADIKEVVRMNPDRGLRTS
jgi:hypothetical protein